MKRKLLSTVSALMPPAAAEHGRPVQNPERGSSTLKDLSKRHRTGLTRLYEEIKLGRLRARKIGRKTIVTPADEDAWLASLPLIEPKAA